METPTETTASRKPLLGIAALAGIAVTIAYLSVLRRDAGRIEPYYGLGNGLETHQHSGFSLHDFLRGLGHLELAVVAYLLSIAARHLLVRHHSAVIAALTVHAAIFYDSVTRYATRLGGHTYLKLCDDALISMRYARNFAAGRGLVYNPGEAVDGFTNPLWTWIMVLPHALGLHEGITSVPIVALGGALLIAMAFLSCLVLEEAGVSVTLQIVLALIMVFDQSLFEFTVLGLETPLLGFGAALVVAGGVKQRERWVTVGLAVLTLARADGAVLAGFMVVWLLVEDWAKSGEPLLLVAKRQWRRFAVVAGVAAALVAWRLAIYGHPAPNTAYLKVYSFAARLGAGIASYGVRGAAMYGLPVLFILWAAHTDEGARRARRMLIPVVGIWAYAMYVGGDAFNFMRFLGPVTPVLWTAVGLAAGSTWTRRSAAIQSAVAAIFVLFAPIQSETGVLGSSWDHANEVKDSVMAAKTLDRNVPPDQEIATFYAGFPYYAPRHRFIDMLGKTEAHIAHQTTIHGAVPGHNKFDFAYVYNDRKPAVTFTALSCPDVERLDVETLKELAKNAPRHVYQAPIKQLLDPTLRDLYLPQRVMLRDGDRPVPHPVGCWFIRKGSTVPLVWQTATE